jgi:hypothetical protein
VKARYEPQDRGRAAKAAADVSEQEEENQFRLATGMSLEINDENDDAKADFDFENILNPIGEIADRQLHGETQRFIATVECRRASPKQHVSNSRYQLPPSSSISQVHL